MIQTIGIAGYLIVAIIASYYFGKNYFNEHNVEYDYEAGYMCVVAPILGLLWPLLLAAGVGSIILRKIL